MSMRTTIKKILLENNKRYNKFAYNVIRYAYDNITNKRLFSSVDNWIRDIKTHFFVPLEKQKAKYNLDKIIDYYGNPLIEGIRQKDIIKIISEFILNFEGSDERIEVDVI